MRFNRSKVSLAVLLSLSPTLVPLASVAQNNEKIEVDETEYSKGVYGDNWKSIEIGTTKNVTIVDSGNKINFDHLSPEARGHNSIAIGTSAKAGENMEDVKTGEAIAIGPKAEA
ncbi:hypothetical protein B4Z38_004826, partial [Escherichia coli]|nr:hypothetical protein [Escherichia coli]